MDVNGEGIFGTRPWKVFGEGPAARRNEVLPGKTPNNREIRFTSKGGRVYAYLLEIPRNQIAIKSLGKSFDPASRTIAKVELLGSRAKLDWKQQADGLTIECPATMPCEHAIALRVTFAE
jgi:alpha-L-fucosidase